MVKRLRSPAAVSLTVLVALLAGCGSSGSSPAPAALVRTSAAGGDDCSAGGVKIEVGIDASHDGVLDPDEIDATQTQNLCNGAQGVAGPAGPQGPIGPQGSQGPVGPPGPGTMAFGTDTNWADPGAGSGPGCTLGTVYLVAGSVGPGGMLANGQLLAINQYTALFSLLGITYGGDGRTTFALPNLRGAAPNGLSYVICTSGSYPSRS